MMYEQRKRFRVSGAIRMLLCFLGLSLLFGLTTFFTPIPLPLWARAAVILQFGLTVLLLGCIVRLVWATCREK